jgi:hypothetical protein
MKNENEDNWSLEVSISRKRRTLNRETKKTTAKLERLTKWGVLGLGTLKLIQEAAEVVPNVLEWVRTLSF